MTFRAALKIIYDYETNTSDNIIQAMNTIKWYEDNILELEDYETDMLYKVKAYIKEHKLEEFLNEK